MSYTLSLIDYLYNRPTNIFNTYTPGAGVSTGGSNNIAVRRALKRRAQLNRGTMQNPHTGRCCMPEIGSLNTIDSEFILKLLSMFIADSQGPLTGLLTLTGNKQTQDAKIVLQSAIDESHITFRVTGLDTDGRSQFEDIIGPGGIVSGPYNGLILFSPKVYPYFTYLIDKNATSSNYDQEFIYLNKWGPHPHSGGLNNVTGSAASAGYLDHSGNLLYPYKCNLGDGGILPSSAAEGGGIIKYDWDGNTLWNWTIPINWGYMPHHDIEPISNGNILLIVIEYNLHGGTSDCVLEIEPNGDSSANIVWTWKVTDYLDEIGNDPSKFSTLIRDGPASSDWNHFNSIYMNELDRIYLSSRNWNEFFVIPWTSPNGPWTDISANIIYRWGKPLNYGRGDASWNMLDAQHSVNEIYSTYPGGGNIILFNNGGSPQEPDSTSQIIELVPPLDASFNYILPATEPYDPSGVFWEYSLSAIHSANRQSGAFRLPNGHTFGISAPVSYMFEVNNSGNIRWDLTAEGDIQRAHQYETDYITPILSRISLGTKTFSKVISILIQEGGITNGVVGAGLQIKVLS